MTALLLECERCGRLRRHLFSAGAAQPMLCVTCFDKATASPGAVAVLVSAHLAKELLDP